MRFPTVILAAQYLIAVSGQNVIRDSLADCSQRVRIFNPKVHKPVYHVDVDSVKGDDTTIAAYNLTFAKYLSETAGKRFNPPITFVMAPRTYDGLFEDVENEAVDFLFSNPGIYSCIGVEYGAHPLVTKVTRATVYGNTYDMDVFGGVMFTLTENHDINTVFDFRDKIIGAGDITNLKAAQSQFYEMVKEGMSYVMDPMQVVFLENEVDVVDGVLRGDFDVGFVRTGQIEQHKDSEGNFLDPEIFKVINARVHVLEDGNLFPFLHSTDIFPEWPLASLPHVAKDVAQEVQSALLALSDHAQAGKLLRECNAWSTSGFCTDSIRDMARRCDTTTELAQLALEASERGGIAQFRTPKSYFQVRTLQETAGFMIEDENGWHCAHGDLLQKILQCPAGYYKLPESEFANSCKSMNLGCKEGQDCYCKPCVKAHDVDVFEHDGGNSLFNATTRDHQGCDKMEICGTVQQTKAITFRVVDNLQRKYAVVSATIHFESDVFSLPVETVDAKNFVYETSWNPKFVGMGLLLISIDGHQIPSSPIRVNVVSRDCRSDFPGQGKIPADDGICVCDGTTIRFGDQCVKNYIVSALASFAAFLVSIFALQRFMRYKNRKNDELWYVNVNELEFDDPVEVIGQGAFGIVVCAMYRGTKVAIKRGIREKPKGVGTRGSSLSRHRSQNLQPDSNAFDVENDVETPSDVENPGCRSKSMGTLHSAEMSLGFLADLTDGPRRFRWLPWRKRGSYESRFNDTILGDSFSWQRQQTLTGVLLPWLNSAARRRESFISEMRVLSRLRHPCITTVMGAVMERGRDPMLVMEYMEYGSLSEGLLQNETLVLTGDMILQILRDVVQGLRYLHSAQPPVMHGDLKANNILIDSRFRAKICDFGLSTKQNNSIAGTPYWLPPEYLLGESKYTAKCDIYSLGIIFYEIYSRKSPYEGEVFRTVLRGICNRRVNKRPEVPTNMPMRIVEITKKCWSADPVARPLIKELDSQFCAFQAVDVEPVDENHHAAQTRKGDMMYEIFPKHIADALKAGQKVEPESHDLVTVVFSDIVQFTTISKEISPLKVSNMLDRLYLSFDKVAQKHQVFKVETIGDAYMGVTNLEGNQDDNHVLLVAQFAIDLILEAGKILIDEEDPSKGYIQVRVGFHSGPVVSNVIGSLNPRYGLFGDTVNTANRMESNSEASRILCSERSYKLLRDQVSDNAEIKIRRRGKINVKGRGEMKVYWVADDIVAPHVVAKRERSSDRAVGFSLDPSRSSHDHTHELQECDPRGESKSPMRIMQSFLKSPQTGTKVPVRDQKALKISNM